MTKYRICPLPDTLAITKALADEQRVRALMALREGELCVCQIVELLALAPSTVSKHLSILRQAGLVECRKNGRWCWFRRAGEEAPEAAREATRWLEGALADCPRTQEDRRRLEEILKIDPEELCRKQCRRC